MKRLKLDDFKAKNLKKDDFKKADQLLGQVLGDCHDDSDSGSSDNGDKFQNPYIWWL